MVGFIRLGFDLELLTTPALQKSLRDPCLNLEAISDIQTELRKRGPTTFFD